MKIRLRVLTFILIVFQFTMTIAQDPNPMDWPNFKQFEELNTKLPKMKKNKNRVVFIFCRDLSHARLQKTSSSICSLAGLYLVYDIIYITDWECK